ncbi:conserved hypothetical protein [Xenorhabdus nematophila F1]|uniref:Uncharacterized protein n=1 Tax=Xenorhabdus nematophila (strain ATCC 19061 / DSM 3370 / CCUG 14189 / LMG 1036 / NCIMB 9965 / AN6) TaxID=406817 RepID=D3VEK5_XENNA|nr:hypothetical protein XNC1_2057 [Xenorhabdus nematophila ATCC 19061]CCW32077.1 conserved hypothetical protein [Xenorhabdus nematophila F1]CEF33218.1 hypothetical protein XNW1_4670005 [Xenorhabdus nematophila str. Websteri]CEF33936.1 hypothetical protein XNW1_720005 [Xenorhabdus nematophila str. Websteri]CEK22984.1 hypothetical protein XNC2_1990 [Xenorhabdus nematophila AN6/1]
MMNWDVATHLFITMQNGDFTIWKKSPRQYRQIHIAILNIEVIFQ